MRILNRAAAVRTSRFLELFVQSLMVSLGRREAALDVRVRIRAYVIYDMSSRSRIYHHWINPWTLVHVEYPGWIVSARSNPGFFILLIDHLAALVGAETRENNYNLRKGGALVRPFSYSIGFEGRGSDKYLDNPLTVQRKYSTIRKQYRGSSWHILCGKSTSWPSGLACLK